MRLSSVIEGTGARPAGPASDPDVTLVTGDSRRVRPGALFVAVPGTREDGAAYAAAAARAGAVAVLAERPVACGPAALLLVPDAHRALALAAAAFHGRPGDALALAGVTGTKGKTTVTWLVEACARAAGVPLGVVGTVSFRYGEVSRPATHTTPSPEALQAFLAEMRDAGVRAACLEVSSHALAQERVAGLSFRAAGFTNLTRDHLDFHAGFEDYFQAKRRLFFPDPAARGGLAEDGLAVVNAGDDHGARLAAELAQAGRRVWRYGVPGAELRAEGATFSLAGIRARLETPAGAGDLASPLVGSHNVENLLCAAGLALGLGLPLGAVLAGLSASPGAPGRLERISARGVSVFVDYAHTDDALTRTLEALRALRPRRLVALFGCGGDRDRGKRPLMGRAAALGADLVVVTSDNPRTEDPAAIIGEILPGVEATGLPRLEPALALAGGRGYLVVPDRREAIDLAIRAAREGDAVLLAGKGHEDYQIVGTEKRHLDDREEARRALGIP
ncbi:UDP-N-acetylmuramoyl-L-alanyl-D-glutamate--2,6-diaminopimelate ligase [Anaeromyxobacter paludicola]|uniref:UDP-N-acetylmuramoyl-L-alanyl-D-glutamate--2,6-diaminopimelate ligase n=1 Tax=Anaeromyxobacter paludicola TaxID=2918171 RepID=A0ABN6NAQ7_9BACT|nr:UDP-N-acetylmuramoyl-L-alanyl-D-glutamate--2,6-diaminopimelate ligase [Anaeromyxobacter paludicola]BDG10310.1 UDP-N-acetylmuramoyl-L-alanyl-D-glutamate--2,6-diaminopimelate ligase [Anaeromyxobacter paludicola]